MHVAVRLNTEPPHTYVHPLPAQEVVSQLSFDFFRPQQHPPRQPALKMLSTSLDLQPDQNETTDDMPRPDLTEDYGDKDETSAKGSGRQVRTNKRNSRGYSILGNTKVPDDGMIFVTKLSKGWGIKPEAVAQLIGAVEVNTWKKAAQLKKFPLKEVEPVLRQCIKERQQTYRRGINREKPCTPADIRRTITILEVKEPADSSGIR